MAKYLVIVESPTKAGKIKSYMGNDYQVIASKGHIRDLPKHQIGIDIKDNFAPSYCIMPDRKEIVEKIIAEAKKADTVFLMSDADREGEGISFHLSQILPKGTSFRRVKTESITKPEVQSAFKNPSEIDMHMVDAYECRRILDRLVGYKVSFLTKQATGGPSAGRVQSAGLRMLAEREKEIQAFVPEEYWPIDVELLTDKNEKILAFMKKPEPHDIKTGDEAKKICDTLRSEPVSVSKYDVGDVNKKAWAPFTTSTMYQAAANILGWKSEKTASVAQKLYESSFITYHRTDSTFIIPDFVQGIRTLVDTRFTSLYVPSSPNVFSSSKGAQEAHEAIRVTDLNDECGPDGDEGKLYKIIWKRTVASQMADMVQRRSSAEFQCKEYVLAATGSRVVFDGWRRVWDYGSSSDTELPVLKVGEKVKVVDVHTEQKFTQPPDRFNTSSLVRELEKREIGRPSTFASIPKTLEARGYIEYQKGKTIFVTPMGMRVVDFLVQAGFCFVDLDFTARLENDLDCIKDNKSQKNDILARFWERLSQDIKNAQVAKSTLNKTDFVCPKCGAKLLKRHGRFGDFLGCENYSNKAKKCDYSANIGEDGKPKEKDASEKKEKKYSSIPCPKCGGKLVEREGKKGKFLGCSSYTKGCKGIYNLDGTPIEFSKKSRFRKKKQD